jgi:hypothetical protein
VTRTAYDERGRDVEFDRLWLKAEEATTDAIEERVRAEAARPDRDPRLGDLLAGIAQVRAARR